MHHWYNWYNVNVCVWSRWIMHCLGLRHTKTMFMVLRNMFLNRISIKIGFMHFRTMILIIFIHFFPINKNPWPSGWEVSCHRIASLHKQRSHLVPLGNVQAYTMYYNSALHFVSIIVGGWFAKQGIDGSEMRIKDVFWPLLSPSSGSSKSDAVLNSILPDIFIPMSLSGG